MCLGTCFRLPPDVPHSAAALAFFASPLLYHNLPTVRTVTDSNGRRYSVADTPSRSFDVYPPRRRTVVGISNEANLTRSSSLHERSQTSPTNVYRRSWVETAPISRKGGSMSKVVRTMKNVTKGYSAVQVKVRNGRLQSTRDHEFSLIEFSHLKRSMGPDGHRYGRNCCPDFQ